MSNQPLEGRVALITGGSRGLGRAMALSLAADGVTLALVARDAGKLAETADEARALGVKVETFVADVTDEAQVNALQAGVAAKLGRVHILNNNAGINIRKQIHEFTLEEWNRVVGDFLRGA